MLHQRARMERLLKELVLEKQKLEHLKSDVNNMEYDALQRRFRRVNSTSLIPRVRTEHVLGLTKSLFALYNLSQYTSFYTFSHAHKRPCTIIGFEISNYSTSSGFIIFWNPNLLDSRQSSSHSHRGSTGWSSNIVTYIRVG